MKDYRSLRELIRSIRNEKDTHQLYMSLKNELNTCKIFLLDKDECEKFGIDISSPLASILPMYLELKKRHEKTNN